MKRILLTAMFIVMCSMTTNAYDGGLDKWLGLENEPPFIHGVPLQVQVDALNKLGPVRTPVRTLDTWNECVYCSCVTHVSIWTHFVYCAPPPTNLQYCIISLGGHECQFVLVTTPNRANGWKWTIHWPKEEPIEHACSFATFPQYFEGEPMWPVKK